MLKMFNKLLFSTLQRQLIFGMVLVVALTMSLFIWDVTLQQQGENRLQQKHEAIALAQSVATSASVWVASRDVGGLQEIIHGLSRYPDLQHAIVLDIRGQVLAHSDPARRGQYLNDLPHQSVVNILQETATTVDVASPVMLADRQIGWVRIGLGRNSQNDQIAQMTRDGIAYALVAILLSTIIAVLAARYLTRRLNAIQSVADAVQAGDADLRAVVSGDDEAAQLARQFNSMLDTMTQREDQLRSFYEFDLVGLTITSPDKGWIRINECLCKMLEYSEQELRGMTWAQLTHPDDLAADVEQFNKLLNNEINGYSLEKRFVSRTGKVIPTYLVVRCVRKASGEVDYVTAMVEDITARKAAEEEIKNLAFYDPLTGLPNRRLLIDRLRQALVLSARSGREGALIFIDLDNFKTLNDTHGHEVGDVLLQQVAQRLESCVREGDTVARLGGDEFVVLLAQLSQQAHEAAAQTKLVALKILTTLNQPYRLDNLGFHNTPSIGATLFSRQQSAEELMKQADIAMYQAKKAGRNTLRFFDPQMQESINARANLEEQLRQAIENKEFELYYQIQVDESFQAFGAEALIRWNHPDTGLVFPVRFIPLAEECGLILPIGQWVLETACAQIKAWQQDVLTCALVLSVNVSARQFRQADFVNQVTAALKRHAIEPNLLKLELTESMLLENVDETISVMNTLNKIGVRFSLDDFGTGYSSLQYLKRLPLDQIKIDQSFVRDLVTDSSDKAIVRTIVAMAESLNLNVIAEGVETEAQRQILLEKGCNHFQGYLFGKPIPIVQFEAGLKEDRQQVTGTFDI